MDVHIVVLIGQRLKDVREQRQLSLRALATLAAVPVSTLSAVESGDRQGENLTGDTLRKLAIALSVTLDYLMCRHEFEAWLRQQSTQEPV